LPLDLVVISGRVEVSPVDQQCCVDGEFDAVSKAVWRADPGVQV
jgi:hypothetical protein